MRELLTKLTPARGFSLFLHYVLVALLPILLYVLIGLNMVPLAYVVVILAKWRMFAVRPRFWPANLRANAVDIMVGLSAVIFMSQTDSVAVRFFWAILYAIWLIALKPRSSVFWVSVQAGVAQLAALSVLYMAGGGWSIWLLTGLSGLICYLAARHFIDNFDEAYARLLSYTWGYFGASLAWLSSHWLLYYKGLAQPTLLLSAIGYGLAALYYFDHFDKLHVTVRRQVIFIMVAIIVVVLTFSDWGDKVV